MYVALVYCINACAGTLVTFAGLDAVSVGLKGERINILTFLVCV